MNLTASADLIAQGIGQTLAAALAVGGALAVAWVTRVWSHRRQAKGLLNALLVEIEDNRCALTALSDFINGPADLRNSNQPIPAGDIRDSAFRAFVGSGIATDLRLLAELRGAYSMIPTVQSIHCISRALIESGDGARRTEALRRYLDARSLFRGAAQGMDSASTALKKRGFELADT